jgi:hypothetical protein
LKWKKPHFTPCKIGLSNFETLWLKVFKLHKVEAFDIVLGNWVENPQSK